MYTKQPKKMLIINILDILREYSDEDHRLSQKDIADILKKDYCMEADRKSIRRNIMNLIDFGYEIEYTEKVRNIPVKTKSDKTASDTVNGEKITEESYIWTDFYLVRTFTNSELRLLIDGLLFSRHVPYSQCRELVQKLEGLSNNYFKSSVGYISKLPIDRTDNRQLFYNIEILRVRFRITLPMISDIIDTFGTDVTFADKDDSGVTVTTITNERAMLQFAKNFAPDVEIIKPEFLRDKVRNELRTALECYEK